MAEPFVLRGKTVQFCLLRRAGYAEDQFAFRYDDQQPWTVWGGREDSAALLYYASALRSDPNALFEWTEVDFPPGAVVVVGTAVMPGKILALFPNANFKRTTGADVRYANPGEYLITEVSLAGVPLRMSAEDSLALRQTFLNLLLDPTGWDSWIPVDGDSAEFSQGVDYGRAPW